ncbi:MAG: glycoside hydrolase, partial [Bacteroidota bacterium]
MMKNVFAFVIILLFTCTASAQKNIDSLLPIRGFCIDAPRPSGLDSLINFINQELAPRKVNTLLLLID